MLTVRIGSTQGCGVAKFCSVDHQKIASSIWTTHDFVGMERHKEVCGLLKKWRQVVKGREDVHACTSDMLAFLQASRPKKSTVGARVRGQALAEQIDCVNPSMHADGDGGAIPLWRRPWDVSHATILQEYRMARQQQDEASSA